MGINQYRALLPIAAIGLAVSTLIGGASNANEIAGKGAQIYCFMRTNGNDHEVSWNAAYESIKRQKSSLFKTSPKHAAVMIIETVVNNPNEYENCGLYLGDMFDGSRITPEEIEPPSSKDSKDRYSY